MGDILLLVGLLLLVTAGFLVSVVAGFILAGVVCVLLGVAFADVRLSALASVLRVRWPWRS